MENNLLEFDDLFDMVFSGVDCSNQPLDVTGCGWSCSGSCYGGCSGNCGMNCSGDCAGGCTHDCGGSRIR